jgi:hypothetical protein
MQQLPSLATPQRGVMRFCCKRAIPDYTNPMVLAHHLIFTTYGFWLPNDPRGSWSDVVRAWELLKFGPATHTHSPRSVAQDPHNQQLRLAAKEALRYPPVSFTGRQALAVAHGFVQAITRSGFVVYACSILPEHVHVVI